MNAQKFSRRQALGGLLVGSAVVVETPLLAAESAKPPVKAPVPPCRYCLNTATIRGQKLGIVKEIEVAAQAGYDGIELRPIHFGPPHEEVVALELQA